ncbi:hypothetical protein EYF80_006266 [Liparis tanakae]|uniref:Uncharacterized protein n=1 Tax=Liparis tanakae TaxID=230148 RepID=A0A4Z2IZ51_9TELE|nr:hypothetical protein EYF80_006266 [Liparis tanakae]
MMVTKRRPHWISSGVYEVRACMVIPVVSTTPETSRSHTHYSRVKYLKVLDPPGLEGQDHQSWTLRVWWSSPSRMTRISRSSEASVWADSSYSGLPRSSVWLTTSGDTRKIPLLRRGFSTWMSSWHTGVTSPSAVTVRRIT